MKTFIIFVQFTLAILFVDPGQAMNPFRKAFVFFAVHRNSTVIAVQSNPLVIADDSESNDYLLCLNGVYTMPGGGGMPVPGFEWENGVLSSEGLLRAVTIPEAYWAANATLYAHFELRDNDLSLVNSWNTTIFLRTIEYISFFFFQSGTSEPQTIPGNLPSSVPDYNFTGFTWSATPFGNLGGASVSFAHIDSGRTAELQISGNPFGGWAQDAAPFDLTITSESDNPDDVCVAEFRGLSWDGLETPTPAAQPSVTLRRLESGGSNLTGYYWIRGQYQGGSAINSNLPPDTDATAILQQSPLIGETLSLNSDCSLEKPNFTPSYPASNKVVIEVTSDTNSFQSCQSDSLLMEFRDFDIDYVPVTDWIFPDNEDPSSVPDADRTLSVNGGDLFDWSDFTYAFNDATILSIEGGIWGKNGLLLGWPVGGLVKGDTGTIHVTLQNPIFGSPKSRARIVVMIGKMTVELGDINGDGSIDLEDVIIGLQVLADSDPTGITTASDVNDDDKIGLEEVVFDLIELSK